jgi:hypothetical protein
MADYHSIIASAVSHLPRTADEARHAIYERARTALHERLGNDPQISDAELVNEHYRLEVAIYEVEEELLLSDMRRFVREETALFPPILIVSKIKKFVRSAGDSHLPPRSAAIHRQADRATNKLRRPGRHRHREQAAA